MGKALYGKDLAESLRGRIRGKIIDTGRTRRPPSIAVIIAGNDPASIYYAELIKRAAAKDGMAAVLEHMPQPDTVTMVRSIEKMNNDTGIDAILIQLPLPSGVDKTAVFSALDPEKDADGQTPENLGKLAAKQKGTFPATALAVLALLKGNGIEISGKNAVVIGRSTAVGLPAALLLLHENATVTLCHTKTTALEKFTARADILVASAGVPHMITGKHVKENAVVVDVGTNEIGGKIVGDVMYDEVIKTASVSPVSGGVGALTLACLFSNVYELYRKNIHSIRDK